MVAAAQAGRGAISGTVTDTTGAIVPGATVTATETATGTKLSTTSTAAGNYSFVSLNPGAYEVGAAAAGFQTTLRKNITVTLDQTTMVNVALTVGAASEVVTVTATSDLVDTSNSTVGQLINSDAIDRVPLLTRNVFDLVQLSAGVTPANGAANSSSSYAIQNISTGRPGIDVSSYSINGAIEGSVYYMIDGSPLGIAENNSAAIIPAMDLPEDAVDQVRVETQNTPASYQSGGAGVISVATKSGTSEFHGDAFGVFRPDVLAANEYFNKQSQVQAGTPNTPPSFHRYQEGGSFGGPISLKKKLFFFGDYEDTQQQQFDGSNYFVVPTTAERQGNFSGDPFTIYDPTQPDIATGPLAGTRQAAANNSVANPSPIAQKFLSMMPKCNMSNVNGAPCDQASDDMTPNFFLPGLDPTTQRKFDVRLDWDKSEAQRIFGRFSFDRLFTSGFNAFGNPWDLNYAQNITNGRNILVGDDYTLNPTTVLQLRYSFTRHYENQGGDPGQNNYDITQLGFPSALAAQEEYKLLPFVTFNDNGSGVGGTANYNTLIMSSENSDANATLTKTVGNHEISAGFEYMKRWLNSGQPVAPSGSYAFDISGTDQTVNSAIGGSDFASFLFGIGTTPGSESGSYPNFSKDLFSAEASNYYAAFVEDTWKPTKAITITAGLRWDIFGGRTERHNRLEYFDPTAVNTLNAVTYTGAEVYANANNRSPFRPNYTNLGPRLGISWQPASHLVVRGGAGFYFGPSTQMVGGPDLNSDGFTTNTTWNATQWNADPNTANYDCNTVQVCGDQGNTTVLNPLSNPFPNGVVQTLTSTAGLGHNLGTTLNAVLHTQRTPTTYNFNFGVEYELPHDVVLSAGYVGSRGLFLPLSVVDLNQLDLNTIAANQSALQGNYVPNQWEAIQDPTNANYLSPTVPLFVALQPYPQFGNGSYGAGNGVNIHGYPGGDSEYSSLQTKVQKRLTGHFTVLSSFTWSKLMTDDSNPPLGFVGSHLGAPQDWKDMSLEHAVSPQDVKYQSTSEASYDLPIGKGRALPLSGVANSALGGWTMNGILYLSDGIPIASPIVGASNGYFNQRPNLACDPAKGAQHSAGMWFSYSCFVNPASQFVPGNAPAYLDHVRTMGSKDLDLSLYKTVALTEKKQIRFEVSSYNVANRAQFGMPNVPSITLVQAALQSPNPSSDDFGQVRNTVNSPRQFQFGAKFTF